MYVSSFSISAIVLNLSPSQPNPLVPDVHWKKKARWVEDGKYITSSGITAGMDAAFAFIARTYVAPQDRTEQPQAVHPKGDSTYPPHHDGTKARDHAHRTAHYLEYRWNTNPEDDPFA